MSVAEYFHRAEVRLTFCILVYLTTCVPRVMKRSAVQIVEERKVETFCNTCSCIDLLPQIQGHEDNTVVYGRF